MYNFIQNLFDFKFTRFFSTHKYLAADFEIIDNALSLDTDSIHSDRLISKILSDLLSDIAVKIRIPIAFYTTVKNKDSDWMKEFEEFKYAKYLAKHFDQIFNKTIGLNTLGTLSTKAENSDTCFISWKIGDRKLTQISSTVNPQTSNNLYLIPLAGC